MPLNEKLKKYRLESGLTQQQIATVLNMDRSTYSYYETGRTSPTINTLKKLKKIFNVTYEQLLEDDD